MATMLARSSAAVSPAANSHVISGADPAIFAALHQPAINLVVWERTLPETLCTALLRLDLCCAADVRCVLPIVDLDDGLPPALASAGWGVPMLAADIAMLARCFAAVMACAAVDVRLDVVRGDACRKFHADFVAARLVTTYLGPGTDWLPDNARDERAVRRLAAGAVGLFKGRTWPTEMPIIHRSPPIAGTGQSRVVLVLNPGDAASGC